MNRKIDLAKKVTSNNFRRNKNNYYRNMSQEDYENLTDEEREQLEREQIQQEVKEEIKDEVKKEVVGKVAKKVLLNPTTWYVILSILGVLFMIIIVVAVITSILGYLSSTSNYAYYNLRCNEVTVKFYEKKGYGDYEYKYTKTFPLEEYVAGVITGEVGFWGDYEVDRTFAIAARTYAMVVADDNCVIESSDRAQVMSDITNNNSSYVELARQAAKDTGGEVIMDNSNNLKMVQYDAFACIDKDDNYYTVSQENQKIPVSWMNSKLNPSARPEWFICNGRENLREHHGNGLSQYGTYYLSTEKKYTYDQILRFYLGDDFVIAKNDITNAYIGDINIKDTTKTETLTTNLSTFLNNNGSNVNTLNSYINSEVSSVGYGTKEAVAMSAVSVISYLSENYNVKIPYYVDGYYQNVGVNPNFGSQTTCKYTTNGISTCYNGFDNSGFITWAIYNGGFKINSYSKEELNVKFGSNSCLINDSKCVGDVGDLIISDCSIQLIVGIDMENGLYYVAEVESNGLVTKAVAPNDSNCGTGETRIVNMSDFYNDSSNRR